MLREIRKKMVILRNRSPFRQDVKDHLEALEHREWIHMFLRLSGSRLTEEEIAERDVLRREYVNAVLGNVRSQLDNTYVVDEKGNKKPLKKG